MDWYIIQAYSNCEKKVKAALEERIDISGLSSKFGEIMIPTEQVTELKKGQKKQIERKFFPGYMLVQMELDDDTWHLVRKTPNVMGFLGGNKTRPSPLTENELNKIFINKVTNLTKQDDIISSFDWETILNNREIFKCKYGILIDKENQLFESKAISNLDTKLMFMVEKEIFYSRNFELPKERCVVWTVNDSDEIMNILNMNVYGVVTDIGDKL